MKITAKIHRQQDAGIHSYPFLSQSSFYEGLWDGPTFAGLYSLGTLLTVVTRSLAWTSKGDLKPSLP